MPALDAAAVTAARFTITIDGHELASFAELVGITTEVQPVDYLESSDQDVVFRKQLPGARIAPTVILRRAMTKDVALWEWHEAVVKGDMVAARKDASLDVFNAEGKPVARYLLEQAWPAKIEITRLKTDGGEVLVETVTIVCANLHRVAP